MISTTAKFRLLHVATHTCAIAGVTWLFFSGQWTWLWLSLVMFLYTGIVGVNISLHRYISHRSFRTGPLRDKFLKFSSFFPMLGSPAAWCSVHVFHHMHSDGPKDPHSPKNAGKFGSWFTLWPEMKIPLSVYRRFVQTRGLRNLHRYYFELVILYLVVLLFIDWRLVPFMWAIPAVGCFHGASSVALLPHIKFLGNYRNHETIDNSHNSWVTWILSLGEGWHNNHHNDSRSYRHGEKWWEIDPSAWLIKHFFMRLTDDR